MDLKRTTLLLDAIAIGDAIGVTGDGRDAAAVQALVDDGRGWPRRAIDRPGVVTAQAHVTQRAALLGGGRQGWRDDTGPVFARQLLAWGRAERRPLDTGLRLSLHDLDAGVAWWCGGRRAAAADHPGDDAVARAIPLAAMIHDEDTLWLASVEQALVTTWSATAIRDAARMTALVRRAFLGEDPAAALPAIDAAHDAWLAACAVPSIAAFRDAAPPRADAGRLVEQVLEFAGRGADRWYEAAALGGAAAVRTACAAALLAASTGSIPAC